MFTEKDFKVTLMNETEVKGFIRKHGEFACICYNTPIKAAEKVGEHCLASGHLSGSRHLYFVFHLENVPRFTVDQLIRHEVGVVKNVQSLRYVNKNGFSIYCPPEMYKNDEYRFDLQRTEEYLNMCYALNCRRFSDLSKERANEMSRTMIPIGVSTECSFACNLEALINLGHKRLCVRAELPIRHLTKMMIDAVVKAEPRYAPYLISQCDYLKHCPEGHSCGKYPKGGR